ncbi:MAG: hypothetical protein IT323_00870 [Anaerolineae bacterium]|nr:hypothetical protein [Anaerolineae bacterium]
MNKRTVKVDMQDLYQAFEFSSDEVEHYLDVETGAILMVMEGFADVEPEDIEFNPRYIEIPAQSSHEGYQEMVDFIDTVRDATMREKLEIAIDGPGAFSRFRNVLSRYPDVQERWDKFKEKRLKARIREWLDMHHITPA